jgi:hypothetical protein
MKIKRRDFLKGCGAASVLLLPGIASSARCEIANSGIDLYIEKWIKASFGGSFSVCAHTKSDGLTYADIEHFGNRYAVISADLMDWKIVGPSFGNSSFAPAFANSSSNFAVRGRSNMDR